MLESDDDTDSECKKSEFCRLDDSDIDDVSITIITFCPSLNYKY